jgi:hypothetical protein
VSRNPKLLQWLCLLQNLACVAVGYTLAFIYDWRVALVVTAIVPLVALGGYFNLQFVMVSCCFVRGWGARSALQP